MMKQFFKDAAIATYQFVFGTPYDHAMRRLVTEHNKLTKQGKDPAKSKTCRQFDAECARLARKEGRTHNPDYEIQ